MKLDLNEIKRILKGFLIILLVGNVTGCSIAPSASEMIPDNLSFVKHYPYTVSLDIKGDEGDWSAGTLISSVDLEAAIETSITQSGVFSKVIQGSGADYRLTVEADATTPVAGFDMTVTVGGTWRLIKVSTNKVIMDEFVTTSHTATIGDAFIGMMRLKLAVAGAAKKFVAEGMRRLSSVPRI